MISSLSQIVYDRLQLLLSVPLWSEERPQLSGPPYATVRIDTVESGQGTAPIHDLAVEVNCVAPTADAATEIAEEAIGALHDYSAAFGDARVAGLRNVDSVRAWDPQTSLWSVTLFFRGVAVA